MKPPRPAEDFGLTDREPQVLLLMAEGLTNQRSALKLSISVSTLKSHLTNIYQELGVQTCSEALVLAAKSAMT
jgi:DNA-binding CsgD family transcriptional regulator